MGLNRQQSTEDFSWLSHWGLDVEGSDVLPSLFGEGN